MNTNSSALDAFLLHAYASSGVDGLFPSQFGGGFMLYSSSESSGSLSSDSDASSFTSSHGDDESSMSSSDSSTTADPMEQYMGRFVAQLMEPRPPKTITLTARTLQATNDPIHDFEDPIQDFEEYTTAARRRRRRSNTYDYAFGDYLNCNYVRKFLSPEVRQRTYELSMDRKSTFRSHFRVPLVTIEDLSNKFITNEWVTHTKRCSTDHRLSIRTQLFVMCTLEHLGNRRPHAQFPTETNMSTSEHRKFFDLFLEKMYSVRREYISFPSTLEQLQTIVSQYHGFHLPGACGSIDVVHVKWAQCPARDFNNCKGKESFPSVAFQCITDNRRRVLGIAPIQYGSRSDKHIVHLDPVVDKIRNGWYQDVEWEYVTINGEVKKERGVYLICDGGYLRWKVLICPYASTSEVGCRGYFNTNLESVRKDVECTYGILKKRWRCLDYGVQYRDMKKCEMLFTICVCLHNMLLDLHEDHGFSRVNVQRVRRGGPRGRDGLWLDGNRELGRRFLRESALSRISAADKREGIEWMERRELLADHLAYCKSIAN